MKDCASRQRQTNQAPAQAGAFSATPSAPARQGVRAALRALLGCPALWLALAACILLGYGYAMAVPAVGVDDLAIETYQQGGQFLLQSRVTQFLLQAATGLLAYQRFWPELFAALCLAAAGVILAAVLYAAAACPPEPLGALLLAGGLLLYPFHAETFAYSNQIATAPGVLLAAAALGLGGRHILAGGHWRGALGAAVCLAFSLGCYESMAQVWLTMMFALLLTAAAAAPAKSRPWRWAVPAAVRGLWPLAAGLALRAALAKLLCALTHTAGADGAAAKTIYWLRRESPAEAVRIFIREFLGNYLALPFGVPALALLALACVALLVWALARRHGNGCGLLTLGLLVSVFAMGILQGTGSQMARASQCFAVFVPFVPWLLLRGRGKRLCAAVCAVLLAAECLSLNQTFAADRTRWRYEEGLLRAAAAQLDELDPTGSQPVVFSGEIELPDAVAGKLPAANPAYKVQYVLSLTLGAPMGDLYAYEEVNESVINWAQSAFGSHEQMALLMEEIGRPCLRPSPEQQAAGDALAAGLPPGTVTQQDGYLLVRF